MQKNEIPYDIKNLEQVKNDLIYSRQSFEVRQKGGRILIICPDVTYKFSNRENFKPGGFLYKMVKRDIDKLDFQSNKYYQKAWREEIYSLKLVNIDLIRQLKKNEIIVGIDLNSAYWQTAFNLGFITKKTFNRGLEYKEVRNKSIAALNSMEYIELYVNGEKIKQSINRNDYKKYAPVYRAIKSHLDDLMWELCQTFLSGNFYMYIIDCVFIENNTKTIKKVQNFLKIKGYNSKVYTSSIDSIEDAVIYITEYKPDAIEKKQITYHSSLY
jgi:hypothetical protein